MTSKIPDLEESIKTLLTNIPKFRYAGIGDNTTSACVTQPFRAFGLRILNTQKFIITNTGVVTTGLKRTPVIFSLSIKITLYQTGCN